MKTQGVSQALIDLLQSRDPVVIADLYSFLLGGGAAQEGSPVPQGGQLLNYTTADIPLTIAGAALGVYEDFPWPESVLFGNGILWDHSETTMKMGMETDTLQVNAYAATGDLINGVPFHQFLRQGGFDNAYLLLQRAYYRAPGGWFVDGWFTPPGWFIRGQTMRPPLGVVWLFSGVVTDVVTGGLSAQIKVDSHLFTLDRKLPRNLYQVACNHQLYAPGCGLNRANFAIQGQVQAGSTIFQLNTNLTAADGYFSLGVLVFTSGVLAGTVAGVQLNAGSTLTLVPPLPAAPAAGDAFTIWPGCDHSLPVCTNKFNNAANFRGFPWIPPPETAE